MYNLFLFLLSIPLACILLFIFEEITTSLYAGGILRDLMCFNNFLFFIFGSILIGISQATQQFYRYAAADNVPDNFKSKALSYVISGGLIAAILGPEFNIYDAFFHVEQ